MLLCRWQDLPMGKVQEQSGVLESALQDNIPRNRRAKQVAKGKENAPSFTAIATTEQVKARQDLLTGILKVNQIQV